MALAYGDFHELSHQLRFLLFEIGIGLPQRSVEYFIASAHRECLKRLHQAAKQERLMQSPILSHHIHDFLDQLQAQLKSTYPASVFFNWQTLRNELEETIANEAMAQAYRQCWQQELSTQIGKASSFWEWLCQKYNTQDLMQFLEQWGCIGHPYHPNYRAKMGFSRREVLQYSPEFNAQIRLHWGALHRDHAHITSTAQQYHDLLATQFQQEYQHWKNQLVFKHHNPEEFFPLPIHPWQWRNQIQPNFSQLIDNKRLILMPHHQLAKPSMSFRTLMPSSGCHLKLATTVRTTSALRTVSPASIDNGPVLSRWLNHILEQHNYYQRQLFVAADLIGLRVNDATYSNAMRQQLAIIYRENPLTQLNTQQILIPLAALFTPSPVSNKPLLIEIIDSSGLNPIDYFRNYCRCLIASQLHLLLCYGFTFEAHQQNTLIAFSQNQPTAIVMRDLGNVSMSTHHFYDNLDKPQLHLDSTILSTDANDLCDKFIHGNFQSNLAHWITHLCHCFNLSAHHLWQIVRIELQIQFNQFSAEIDNELLKIYKNQLLIKQWQHKSLLTMRLCKENHDHFSVPTANLLSNDHE